MMLKWIVTKLQAFKVQLADRLSSDVRYLHRMWSTWVAGGGLVGIPVAWMAVPPDLRAALPNWALAAGGVVLFLLFLLARGVSQPKIDAARDGAALQPPTPPPYPGTATAAHPYGDVR